MNRRRKYTKARTLRRLALSGWRRWRRGGLPADDAALALSDIRLTAYEFGWLGVGDVRTWLRDRLYEVERLRRLVNVPVAAPSALEAFEGAHDTASAQAQDFEGRR